MPYQETSKSYFIRRQTKPTHLVPINLNTIIVPRDGKREGTCQDWEIEAAYYNWSNQYDESDALDKMKKVFGEELPR